jgi:hypothetical protein
MKFSNFWRILADFFSFWRRRAIPFFYEKRKTKQKTENNNNTKRYIISAVVRRLHLPDASGLPEAVRRGLRLHTADSRT